MAPSELEVTDEVRKKDARAVAEMDELMRPAFKSEIDKMPVLCGCAARAVNHMMFELAVAVVIFTNAAVIGAEVQHASAHTGPTSAMAFTVLRYLYSVVFLAELLVRLLAYGARHFFCGDLSVWNWFDSFIVASSILEVIAGDAGGGLANSSSARLLRILKMTRVLRILRIPRLIRYITTLQKIIHAIIATFKSLAWAMILLALIIYVHAILITQVVVDHRAGGEAVAEHVDMFWGSLWLSALTLFGSICGGVSWLEASQALRSISVSLELVFLAYVCFTHFAVLNVVTGVFCSSAIESAQSDPDMIAQSLHTSKVKVLKQMEVLFHAVDTDGSGCLTVKELEDHLDDITVQAHFAALGVDSDDVWTLFKLLDTNDDALISLEEFFMGCVKVKGQATAIDIAKLSEETRFIRAKLGQIQHMLTFEHGCPEPPAVQCPRSARAAMSGSAMVPSAAGL